MYNNMYNLDDVFKQQPDIALTCAGGFVFLVADVAGKVPWITKPSL